MGKNVQRAEIVFILDASGSMAGLEDDTVGGFNSLVEKNREEPGEATVSTILFSSESRVVHDRLDIRRVPRLTRDDYRCCGCTALLDAVGGAIKHVDLVQSVLPEGYRADRVLFVITTDGMENASRRYSEIASSHDREEAPEGVGVPLYWRQHRRCGRGGAAGNSPRPCRGLPRRRPRTKVLYDAMATAVAQVRACAPGAAFGDAWREGIDADVRARRR